MINLVNLFQFLVPFENMACSEWQSSKLIITEIFHVLLVLRFELILVNKYGMQIYFS